MELGIPQSFSRVLSSMCTEPHPAAREAAEQFIATNPGDPGTYETVADLESTVVDRLGEITGLDDPAGYVASGGTEANIQALRLARNRADTPDPNVVVPASGHFSFTKAADVLGIELRVAPLDGYTVSLEAVEELLDEDTVAVVGVAGSTEYGRVDPIPALADLVADAPGDPLFHVDAAWGGFVLPFTNYAWGFADAAVDTLTIDPHKMGQAVVPAGGLLAREKSLLAELAVDTPYLESTSQITLTGTRSGAGVASAAVPRAVRDRTGERRVARGGVTLAGRRGRLADPAAGRGRYRHRGNRRGSRGGLAAFTHRTGGSPVRDAATRHPRDASGVPRGSR